MPPHSRCLLSIHTYSVANELGRLALMVYNFMMMRRSDGANPTQCYAIGYTSCGARRNR